MIRYIVILIIGFTILGCASIQKRASRWHRENTTNEMIVKDYRECSMYGDAHSEMNPFMASSLEKQCMENKGYIK